MKNIIFCLSILVSATLSLNVEAEQDSKTFSDAELAQILAPIALYPDSLLTHILISSTYPIEIVEAHRWLEKYDSLDTGQVSERIEKLNWDPSVKALIQFEHVLTRLSEDLSWTQALGDAFLQDESRLLETIQTLREQARLAGSLNKMDNMDIGYEDNNIIIAPREKEVVYVPYYDSRMVFGTWAWSAYPPVYWQPYRSAYVSHYKPFYWQTGVRIRFNYFFSAFHWHNRHVVIVKPNRFHPRYYHQRPRRLVANGGYAKRWIHKPAHRKGVAYRTKKTSHKYYSNRVAVPRTQKQLKTRHGNVKHGLHIAKHSTREVTPQVTYTRKSAKLNKTKTKTIARAKSKATHKKVHSRPATKQQASNHKPKSSKHTKNGQISGHKSGSKIGHSIDAKSEKSHKTTKKTRTESSISNTRERLSARQKKQN